MESANAASMCRQIAERARTATLGTLAREPAGFPYTSLVAVAWDHQGRPILCLSALAEHTKNLSEHKEASLLVVEQGAAGADPLSLGRVTLIGPCERLPANEGAAMRPRFVAAVPTATAYVDLGDFGWYRLEPVSLRYVGGFGRMTWVDGAAYRAA